MKHFLICFFILFSQNIFADVEQGDTGQPTNFPSNSTVNGATTNYDLPLEITLPALTGTGFTGGTAKLTVYGNIVILSATSTWTSLAANPYSSQDGFIPEAYRPPVDVSNVFRSFFDGGFGETSHQLITITTSGQIIAEALGQFGFGSWQSDNRPTIAWVL